ncbi:MAG: hypothetical protein KKD44_25835 [Proteobacteria bacterium]|nr:hypothetical protein [Pseudomonadota bacterium]
MRDEDRGKIRNKKYISRLRDFSGLKWDKITPTDIDAFVEFSGRLFIFIEAKIKGTELERGQKLAFERLGDAITKGESYFIIADQEKTEKEPEDGIDYSILPVRKYRYKSKWYDPPQHGITVKEFIITVRKKYGFHSIYDDIV